MGYDYNKSRIVALQCGNQREAESVREFLKQLYLMDDDKLERNFKLMPHEVQDVKDILRRSVV